MPLFAGVYRHDFPGVGAFVGVKDRSEGAHGVESVRCKQLFNIGEFIQPNTMFAGDGSTSGNAESHDFLHGLMDPLRFVGVVGVVGNIGVKISVAGVKNIADVELLFSSNFLNPLKKVSELCSGNHGVLHNEV